MSISTPFIKRPVATSLLMAAFLLVGIAAYPFLPVAPLPRVDFPTIVVTGKLPGASPETMASTVAQPLEYQFAQIAGVSQMTSISVLGRRRSRSSSISTATSTPRRATCRPRSTPPSGQLPKNLPGPPTYRKVNPADSPDPDPRAAVRRAAADQRGRLRRQHPQSQQISQIAGRVAGDNRRRAEARRARAGRPGEARRHGHDARGRAANARQRHGQQRPRAVSTAATRSLHHLRQRPAHQGRRVRGRRSLAYRNGAAVRVRDIGRAVDGPENDKLPGWQSGHRGILLLVFKQPGANVIDTVERMKAALPAAGSRRSRRACMSAWWWTAP